MSVTIAYKLLPPQEKKRGLLAVIYALLSVFLELISLASLVPLIILLFQHNSIHTNQFFHWLFTCVGFSDDAHFVLCVSLLVVLLLLAKNYLSHALNISQTSYLLRLYKHFSLRLFTFYYNKGLLFFKDSNTSRLVYSVNYVSYAVIFSIFLPAIKIGAKVLLLLLLLGVVVVLNVKVFMLFIAVFIPFIFINNRFIKRKLLEIGRVENESRKEQTKIVHETFKGYAEVEVNDVFPMLLKSYKAELEVQCICRQASDKVKSIGSSMLEVGIFVGIIGFLLSSYFLNGHGVALAFLAVLLMLLLSSMREVFNYVVQIKSNLAVWDVFVDLLRDGYQPTSDTQEGCITFQRQIDVKNLSFSFKEGKTIFSNMSFSIRKGEKVGVRGLSGSGKSTLFHLLLGLYAPSQGAVLIDDVELTSLNRKDWHQMAGYVSQDVFILDGSVTENVAVGVSPKDVNWDRLRLALEQANLSNFLQALPKGLDSMLGDGGCKVSGGERQRIGIARALYKNASILFFDEATSAVDVYTEREIISSIEQLSKKRPDLTMLVIAHRKAPLAFCDRIIEL
jgi:ABC-type multidrug transport system fused ATPase/permease subunit